MSPRVSICVPTYNRAATLRKTIDAMLAQTFSDWELIICDDASTDNTSKIVADFRDVRIRYHRHSTNLGLYANWNYGVSLATGEYVAIYHDHDLYQATIVERSVALLDRYPAASFVHTALRYVDDQDAIVGVDIRNFEELTAGDKMRRQLAKSWHSPIMAATTMVRRDAYHKAGPYRFQEYGLGCDLDMWFRLCQYGDVAYVNEPQVLIRTRTKGQGTARFNWSNVVGTMRMRRDHLNLAFSPSDPFYYLQLIRFMIQRDVNLASLALRAVLLESSEIANEGERVLKSWASFWVRWVYLSISRNSIMKDFLRKCILPIHYWKVSKEETARREKATLHSRGR